MSWLYTIVIFFPLRYYDFGFQLQLCGVITIEVYKSDIVTDLVVSSSADVCSTLLIECVK